MVNTTWRPGALVSARDRIWVVLPPDEQDVVRLRPVDGHEDEAVGVFLPLEPAAIHEARYEPPAATHTADFAASLLLYDAARLKLRSGAGPIRSLGHISVTPRPYQFVPLLMALRLDPVRLLIADDVGVGKTIEAAMIARELMDRGIVRRIGVLCAPHLCEQWAEELKVKFNIDAAVVQPARMAKLERALPRQDVSVFRHNRHLVASIDFVKSDRYRRSFVDNAPDFLIVDEAHTVARPRSDTRGRAQHQRHELVTELAADERRHLVLTTATPHSGIEESFRSLLGLLNLSFDVPEEERLNRAAVARHFVQRRRADLQQWLGSNTPFPDRDPVERTYRMSEEYARLYERVRDYCQGFVAGSAGMRQQQRRVRYWAATAILRCLLSSPASAEAMLQARAQRLGDPTPESEDDPDQSFAPQVLDSSDEEEPSDYVPNAPLNDAGLQEDEVRRLDGFLRDAQRLRGVKVDHKLAEVVRVVDDLLRDGYRPIVYCRFIATASYVAEQLQQELASKHRGLTVRSVTGGDGDSDQRREIVLSLAESPVRVLVATDCLSEGINLQEHFDAVVHYDLPWNPNRLEQREGRVDRYGQERPVVKAVLLYGADNPVDLTVLEVLIRKARTIRSQLGISVPVPVESEQVVQAIIDNVLLRQRERGSQMALPLEDERVSRFHRDMDEAANREQASRRTYAQLSLQPNEVARELEELEPVLGSARALRRFMASAAQRVNGSLRETPEPDVFEFRPGEVEAFLKARWRDAKFPLRVSFTGIDPNDPLPAPREGVELLGRNHPLVEGLADFVLERSLSGDNPLFARAGATFTRTVDRRTALYVVRLRYMLEEKGTEPQFAEEVVTVAARSDGGNLTWLDGAEAIRLLEEAQPAENMAPALREEQVTWALGVLERDPEWYTPLVNSRRLALEESHARLRAAVNPGRADGLRVDPHTPPDVLGCFVLVPIPEVR